MSDPETCQLLCFLRYKLFSSLLSFGPVMDGRTESDANEPTVHKHRCAQKSGTDRRLNLVQMYLQKRHHTVLM